GDFEMSSTLCEKYVEIAPDDAEAINDMANCYFKLGDFEKAEHAFARALTVNENLVAVYRNLGLTKLRLGKSEEALALLQDYIKICPEDLETELAIAGIYSHFGDYVTAIQHYERFLIGNAQSVEGLFGISECYYHLGHIDSAAIGYRQILSLNPDFQPAANRLAEIETSKTPA
ncbi:MAG: tetratricopeptide repeat protein, partial [Candidatus Zixiibacteriota bacterium]